MHYKSFRLRNVGFILDARIQKVSYKNTKFTQVLSFS